MPIGPNFGSDRMTISSRSSPSSKILLRKAARRSVETAWQRSGDLLDRFPPDKCANYLHNAHDTAT